MAKKRQYSERELDKLHSGPGYKKGLKAEAKRQVADSKKTLLGLLLAFVLGLVIGGLVTRNRD